MPIVHVTYDFVYAEVLGPLDKRLSRVLRGRPATEEPPAADQVEAGQAGEAPAEQRAERGGLWTAVLWLTRAFAPLLGDEREGDNEGEDADHVEVEIRLDLADVDEEGEGGDNPEAAAGEDDLIEAIQGEFQMVPEDDEPPQQQEQRPQPQVGGLDPPLPPNPIAFQRQQRRLLRQRERQLRNQNRNENENGGQNRLVEEPRVSLFSILMNGMTTTLLFPAISYSMGELVRKVVPASWALPPSSRRPATGLLQFRWGRSLVGACLFFVLRDAFALFYKYRRVQVKLGRKVLNVEKKTVRGTEGQTAEAS